MKTAKLFTMIGLFMCFFLIVACPSECENDDGDCFTPYGPCDGEPENTSAENQNQAKDQKTLTINSVENVSKNNE